MIEFGSVCSGIEAASVAWHPLGWRAAWLAEKFGELIKAVLDESPDRVHREAVQTAAMCVRLVLDGDGSVKEWMARGLAPLFQPKEGPAT